jgi:hypothetical protein
LYALCPPQPSIRGDIPQAHRTTLIWTNEAVIDADLVITQIGG